MRSFCYKVFLFFLVCIFCLVKTTFGQAYSSPVIIATSQWATSDMIVDPGGDIFFCGYQNTPGGIDGRIYKIKKTQSGYDPNYVLIASGLGTVWDVVMDQSGNLFSLDVGGKIFKISSTGGGSYGLPILITTGLGTCMGLAIDKSSGNLYSPQYSGKVYEITNTGGIYSPTPTLIAIGIGSFSDITIDNLGTLYITSEFYDALYSLPKVSGVYNSVPSLLVSGLSHPTGITIDSCGNLFTCNQGNFSITEIVKTGNSYNPSPVFITSGIIYPQGIAVDREGNLFSNYTTPADIYFVKKNNPQITISAGNLQVCANSNVTFTASVTNMGAGTFEYRWKKNGIDVGSNSPSYSDNTLNNNDIIYCELVGTSGCYTVTSDSLTMSIVPSQPLSISITSTVNTICTEGTVLFNAITSAPNSTTSFQWKKNGVNVGSNTNTYSDSNLDDGDIINCVLTSNNSCLATSTANSNNIIMTVLQSPTAFLPLDTSICPYEKLEIGSLISYTSYLWNTNSTTPSIIISSPGLYWVEVSDNNNCKGIDSILVNPKDCMKGFYVPSAFTPNNDSKNDKFRPLLFGNIKQYKFTLYNRWGQLIFQTTEIGKGWDGTFRGKNQDPNVFIWTCTYQLEGENTKMEKGTVMLIR